MLNEVKDAFYGKAIITVRFKNHAEWQKWRKYILKTDWDFDGGAGPYVATLEMRFNCVDDIEKIVKQIVQLLQLNFEVYSCQWKLDEEDVVEYTYLSDNGTEEVIKVPVNEKEK